MMITSIVIGAVGGGGDLSLMGVSVRRKRREDWVRNRGVAREYHKKIEAFNGCGILGTAIGQVFTIERPEQCKSCSFADE